MSAIAGILHPGGQDAQPHLLARLTSAMQAQGPDAVRQWASGPVALGHCLLATTPEAVGEVQPLADDDGSIVVVFDGRLDNRAELLLELRARGRSLRSATDTELVLRAYEQWGRDSPAHLLGDFAFAIWDARRRLLFCARDHFGARPFYYATLHDGFAFASSDEALTLLDGVTREPNEERIADVLVPGLMASNPARSWYRDVSALLSGDCLTVDADGRVEVRTYWQPEPGELEHYASDEECEEAFLAVFDEAVRCRLRSNGEPAALVSGGLDSAAVCSSVQSQLARSGSARFHAYSVISDRPDDDIESRSIGTLASSPGTQPHRLCVPSLDGPLSLEAIAQTLWSGGHPVNNSACIPALLAKMASSQGHRVLLHAVSGDATQDSPDRYAAHLMRDHRWLRAWQECRDASRHNTYLQGQPATALFLRNAWTAFAPTSWKAVQRRLRATAATPPWRGVLRPEFAARLESTRQWHADALVAPSSLSAHRAMRVQALTRAPGLVAGLTGFGRAASRFGVEMRDPWADRRVVDFFLRLPLERQVRHGWTKHVVRCALRQRVDPAVLWRSDKEHLGWQLVCSAMDASHALIAHALRDGAAALDPYVDPDRVRSLFARYETHRRDEDRFQVFRFVTLALWLEMAQGAGARE